MKNTILKCFVVSLLFAMGVIATSCKKDVALMPKPDFGDAPEGAVNGKFTVNGNGDQVFFSQGNLQFQASTGKWHFATQQYHYIGDANSNLSSSYDGWVDLFGWGTSGWNSGAVCYQPWSTSTSSSDYFPGGSYTNNLTGSYANADWGVYNAISNGGNTANTWRTLTVDEWEYAFNTRTTSSGIRYAKACVNSVNGVILLPDDWSTSTYSLSNTNSSGANYTANTITATQWATLEQHGAVFLPAAGSRDGSSVYSVGSLGRYWSASYYNGGYAYDVWFYSGDLDPQTYSYRYDGLSVRLVRSVTSNPTPVQISDYSNIVINELNGDTKFIELYNKGDMDLSMEGMYILKDDNNAGAIWTADATIVIPSHGYVLLYSEDVTCEGGFQEGYAENLTFHSGLSAKKTIRITLFMPDGTVRDEFTRGFTGEWGYAISNVAPKSYARTPDGGEWKLADPTPGVANPSSGEDIPQE